MALIKTLDLKGDATVAGDFWRTGNKVVDVEARDCYIKVVKVDATKEAATAHVSYAADGFSGFKQFDFVPSLDGGNFIAQAYEHLKTLPEFSDAIDC